MICSRQAGKTAGMSVKIGTCAVEERFGGDYLVIALTEKQAYQLFFKTLMFLKAVYPQSIKYGKDAPTKHEINLKNGITIRCYAAGKYGDGLRTFTIKKLFIDEAAPMLREVYIAVMPMLAVTGGTVDMASTPRGKEGFFYDCSLDEDFTKFYVSALDCPRHTKEFLEKQEKAMTKLSFAQEYLAKFLDEVRQVISNKLIEKWCIGRRRETILKNRAYFIGVDIARMGEDESTFEIIDRTDKKKLVQVENMVTTKTLTTQTTIKILELNKKYDFRQIFVDDGGLGVGVFDQLLTTDETKRKVIAIYSEARPLTRDEKKKRKVVKEEIVNNFLMLMERGEIICLDDDELKLSLRSLQWDIKNGRVYYFGNYTHIAMGLIFAAWCSTDKRYEPGIF